MKKKIVFLMFFTLLFLPITSTGQNNTKVIHCLDLSLDSLALRIICVDTKNNLLWTKIYIKNEITEDGEGGFFISLRTHIDRKDKILFQHIDKNGNYLFEGQGKIVCNTQGNQYSPNIINDGNGNAIVIWEDCRDDPFNLKTKIYLQKFDKEGNKKWIENGIPICLEFNKSIRQRISKVITDEVGGIYVSWIQDGSNSYKDGIYLQHIDKENTIRWNPSGVQVSQIQNNMYHSKIALDKQNSGVFIAWNDSRNSKSMDYNSDIFIQKVDSLGTIVWLPNGTEVCTDKGFQLSPDITDDEEGGVIIAWLDKRSEKADQIYVQHINKDGLTLLEKNGIPITRSKTPKYAPVIIKTGHTDIYIFYMKCLQKWQSMLLWSIAFLGTNAEKKTLCVQKIDRDCKVFLKDPGKIINSDDKNYLGYSLTNLSGNITIATTFVKAGKINIKTEKLNNF